MDSSSEITMQLGGLALGEFDQLLVSEALLNLDGTLVLSLTGGFVPESGDTFTIISGTLGILGEFANAAPGDRVSFEDGSFLLTQAGNDIVLSDFQPVPEPSVVLLLVCGLLAVYLIRVRRCRAA